MARLNPKRRLLAKVRLYDDMAHRATVTANTEPQQQGAVRSSCDKYTGFAHLSAPRERWEGQGKRKRPTHSKPRPNPEDVIVYTDSIRAHEQRMSIWRKEQKEKAV